MVFEILDDLKNNEGKTIIMVEQNAKKGLEFADIGYVLVSGEIEISGTGDDLLNNSEVGKLFLGGWPPANAGEKQNLRISFESIAPSAGLSGSTR